MKWYTKTIYLNSDTGEEINKQQAKENYTIIKKTKKIQHDNFNTGIVTITNYCRKLTYKQIKLQL